MKYLGWAAVPLLLSACQFDGSGVGDGAGSPGQDTAAVPELGLPDLPFPGRGEYVATSEATRHGELLAGSYRDSHVLDGRFEEIGGEVHEGEERLEHKWFIDSVAAGTYEVSLVLSPFAPQVEAYEVEYKVEGETHESLFLIPGDGLLQEYEGTVTLDTDAPLELRAKIDHVQAEGEVADSSLEVHYLALSPSTVGIGP